MKYTKCQTLVEIFYSKLIIKRHKILSFRYENSCKILLNGLEGEWCDSFE